MKTEKDPRKKEKYRMSKGSGVEDRHLCSAGLLLLPMVVRGGR